MTSVLACDRCRRYWRADRGIKVCPQCGGPLAPRNMEVPGEPGGQIPAPVPAPNLAAQAMTGLDSDMMRDVMSKMDMGAFANAIEAFAETFKTMERKTGEILARTDTLLHNQSLIYSLLQRAHEDLLATRPLPMETVGKRVHDVDRDGDHPLAMKRGKRHK